jgi:7,8-dihydroneopterin aldolase/epimerase/oxygenase
MPDSSASATPLVTLALMAGLHRIFLRNFTLTCSIGIHPGERAAAQRVLVNVDLFVEAGGPVEDRIEAVLNYDFLREEVMDLAASRHFDLQETLADAIAQLCLTKPGVAAARVSTEKPDVYPDCEAVGVEILRAGEAFRRLMRHQAC